MLKSDPSSRVNAESGYVQHAPSDSKEKREATQLAAAIFAAATAVYSGISQAHKDAHYKKLLKAAGYLDKWNSNKGNLEKLPIPPQRDRVNPVAAMFLALRDWRDSGFFEVP